MDTRDVDVASAAPETDELWNSFFQVGLVPNPLLSEQQQQIISGEYGLVDGILTINVRRAMLDCSVPASGGSGLG